MLHDQNDLHKPDQQKQQEIFAQLRAYRQQLDRWHQDQAAIEQRLTVFRQRQHALLTQLKIWHGEQDYLSELMEREEQKLGHDGTF